MGDQTKLQKTRRPPAKTPRARENQMIALAIDQVEEQLRAKRASSQVLVHYLRLATERERLERLQLERQNQLLEAKTEAIKGAKRIEELYTRAVNAMRSYSGGEAGQNDEQQD